MVGFRIIKARKPIAPPRNLIVVGGLTASAKAFGPSYLDYNVAKMREDYSHPKTGELIHFREPTTSESILAASCDFGNMAKPQILDPRWLQQGRIVRTSKRVYANPPIGKDGKFVTDEAILKSLLRNTRPISVGDGVIYIVPDSVQEGFRLHDFGCAEYGTFRQEDFQAHNDFLNSGLAKLLEHTEQKPEGLSLIATPEYYPKGVCVTGFDPVSSPILRVVGLYSSRDTRRRLIVDGHWGDSYDDGNDGCAFGVYNKSAEGTRQKSGLDVRTYTPE